jgi:hypothetical protein
VPGDGLGERTRGQVLVAGEGEVVGDAAPSAPVPVTVEEVEVNAPVAAY